MRRKEMLRAEERRAKDKHKAKPFLGPATEEVIDSFERKATGVWEGIDWAETSGGGSIISTAMKSEMETWVKTLVKTGSIYRSFGAGRGGKVSAASFGRSKSYFSWPHDDDYGDMFMDPLGGRHMALGGQQWLDIDTGDITDTKYDDWERLA